MTQSCKYDFPVNFPFLWDLNNAAKFWAKVFAGSLLQQVCMKMWKHGVDRERPFGPTFKETRNICIDFWKKKRKKRKGTWKLKPNLIN